jgi:glycosyltransferase involved in cell wall biosynthesis
MACRNAEKYVAESIQSVISQRYNNWELIVVDDASTDSSAEQIRKYLKVDDRVKYIQHHTRRGPAAARNAAASTAKGKWLSILDADDVFYNDKLSHQLSTIKQKPKDLVLIASNSVQINQSGIVISKHSYPQDSNSLKKNLLDGKKFPPHSSIAYRKSAFDKLNGFKCEFDLAQDYELWLRMSENGSFASCGKPLVQIRLHNDNLGKKKSTKGYSQSEYAVAARVLQMMRLAVKNNPNSHFEVPRYFQWVSGTVR